MKQNKAKNQRATTDPPRQTRVSFCGIFVAEDSTMHNPISNKQHAQAQALRHCGSGTAHLTPNFNLNLNLKPSRPKASCICIVFVYSIL